MHHKSCFPALNLPCKAHYNALYNLINYCTNSYTMHFKFGYNYLQKYIMYFNAYYG